MIPTVQKRFLATLSALLAKMAKADGVVTQSEDVKVRNIWGRMGLTQEQSDYCSVAYVAAQTDGVTLSRYVKDFITTKYGNDTRAFLYGLMWDVACADGVLHKNEKSILCDLPVLLGLDENSFDLYYKRFITNGRIALDAEVEELRKREEEKRRRKAEEEARKSKEAARQRQRAEEEARRKAQEESRRRTTGYPKGSVAHAYAMLGCKNSDSIETLRHAYRRAALKWHPDRFRSDGMPEELVRKATDMMSEINNAWETIKKHRGIK